jgi:menaquinone-dependent protoporphyrinogen oxidase
MKVLIAVVSKHGSTREIAQAISEELQAANIAVDILNLAKGEIADVENYDAVLLGSAIYAGNWLPEAKKFAQKHQDELSSLPVWLFSSGPLGADNPQPQDDPEKLSLSLGQVKAREHHVFAGKLDSAELGLAERVMVKMVHAPGGDFRDWDDISDWGREIAKQLHAEVAVVNTSK